METFKPTEEEFKPISGEELRLLYSAVLNDIQFIKKQQVEGTNYIVAILVAVILFYNMTNEKLVFKPTLRFYLIVFLSIVTVFTTFFGVLYILKLERDMNKSRLLKNRIIGQFPKGVRDILQVFEKPNQLKTIFTISPIAFFSVAIGLGVISVFVFLIVR